jgi:hypothetical protein
MANYDWCVLLECDRECDNNISHFNDDAIHKIPLSEDFNGFRQVT